MTATAPTREAADAQVPDPRQTSLAALRHRRIRRRRQVDPRRQASVRHQVHPCRRVRGGRARHARARRRGRRPGAAHRRPARRARARHHDRRRLSLLLDARGAPSSSRIAPGTCSTRATRSRARPRPTPSSSSSTSATGWPSRHAATSRSRPCCGSPTSSSPSTRWTSSAWDREPYDAIAADAAEHGSTPRDRPSRWCR